MSNLYCNVLNQCVSGWQFEYSRLRYRYDGPSSINKLGYDYVIHGLFKSQGDILARPNSYMPFPNAVGRVPWGADIVMYTPEVDLHKWDFLKGKKRPLISYPVPALGSKDIVHKVDRKLPLYCKGYLAPDSALSIVHDNPSDQKFYRDSLLDWKINHLNTQLGEDSLNTGRNASLAALVRIERSLQEQDFVGASMLLKNYIPGNRWEADFRTVYQTWCDYQLSPDTFTYQAAQPFRYDTAYTDDLNYTVDTLLNDTSWFMVQPRALSPVEIATLSAIAKQNPITQNPASHAARTLLLALAQLHFEDEALPFYPSISGSIDPACLQSYAGLRVDIYTAAGLPTGIYTYTDGDGQFWMDGAQLKNLDSGALFYLRMMGPDAMEYTTPAARWHQLAYSGPHHWNCHDMPGPAPLEEAVSTAIENIRVYPVPASGTLHVAGLPESWSMSLKDLSGRTLQSLKGNTEDLQLNVGPYAPGFYLLELTTEPNKTTHVFKIRIH